jgi:hypothetical protein
MAIIPCAIRAIFWYWHCEKVSRTDNRLESTQSMRNLDSMKITREGLSYKGGAAILSAQQFVGLSVPVDSIPFCMLVRLLRCMACVYLLSFYGIANAQPNATEPPTEADKPKIIAQFVRNWKELANGLTADKPTITSEFYPLYRFDDGFWPEDPRSSIGEQIVQLPSWLAVIDFQGSPIAGIKVDMPSVTAGKAFDADEASRMMNYMVGDKFIAYLPKDHFFIVCIGG